MSADAIARVVRDLKMGWIANDEKRIDLLNEDTITLSQWADVIDATPVWARWMDKHEGTFIYEDHRICPPWANSLICFVNGFGNVTALSVRALDITVEEDKLLTRDAEHWVSLADTHVIDWDRVRWIIHAALYMGGRGGGEPVRTFGPLHAWRIAVYPDGEIADLNWIQLRTDIETDMWDTAMMVLLDTFNLCNCVNVQIAEPERPRPQRKRLKRMGVTVSEIHVKPISKSYRGKGTPLSAVPVGPLSAVRGHFAQYGPKYGRGLLFGKYEGRYWVPQHVRGSEIYGVKDQEYAVEP